MSEPAPIPPTQPPLSRRMRRWFGDNRALVGRFLFELVVVFVGVTAAFAMEGARRDHEETEYRRGMIAALVPTLDNVLRHNDGFDREVSAKLAAFDAARARGERPALPIFREENSERPPVRAWDGVVETGAARALDPALFFDLNLFYTRQESFGEQYIRYTEFAEQRIYTLGPNPAVLYDEAGALRPEFAAHLDTLRRLRRMNDVLTVQAVDLRDRLAAQD